MDIFLQFKNLALAPLTEDGLSRNERFLCAASAITSCGDFDLLERWLEFALGEEVSENEVYETLLQSYLFSGYPTAIEALIRFSKCSKSGPRIFSEEENGTDWVKRGEKLCSRVYGSNYLNLRKNFKQISPELEFWMIMEGYGKVLSRKALIGRVREICCVASLIVSGFQRQLHSHIRGALNLGCTQAQLSEAFEIAKIVTSPQNYRLGYELCESVAQ